MGLPDRVPTLEQVCGWRAGKPIPKEVLGVKDRRALARQEERKDEDFRREVYRLDHGCCRCCGCTVVRTIERVPEQAAVHHVHGRAGVFRRLALAALLLCRECHERVTGRVNDKLVIVGTKFFRIGAQRYINARERVEFEEAA